MSRFVNKVVIVTGGASGIGLASVNAFAEEGAKVVVADFSDHGEAVVNALRAAGTEAIFLQTDVRKTDQVQKMIDQTVATFGRVDVMFANAGVGNDAAIEQLQEESWQRLIDINLTGVYLCDKYAIAQMLKQGGGVIVNCGSIHSHVGKAGVTGYAAAKGGVKLLTQSLAIDYGNRGIRVNAVCPGYIDTPLLKDIPESGKSELIKLHPMGRLGRAEEVAQCVLFLASKQSSFVNGSSLLVDGGYTAQ